MPTCCASQPWAVHDHSEAGLCQGTTAGAAAARGATEAVVAGTDWDVCEGLWVDVPEVESAAEAVSGEVIMGMAIGFGRGLDCYVPPTEAREAVSQLFSALSREGWLIVQPVSAPQSLGTPSSGLQKRKTLPVA